MELKENTLRSVLKYAGKIVTVKLDDIELPDGSESKREIVMHPGGVCIAAKNEKGEFLIVEQFRYAFSSELLEFPAGKLEPGEDPLEAAIRELHEETGYEAKVILPMGKLYASPGYLTEIIHLYYAPETVFVGQELDPGEFLNVRTYTLDQLNQLAMQDILRDGKTLALLFKLNQVSSTCQE